jgi:hypothetical protein
MTKTGKRVIHDERKRERVLNDEERKEGYT